MNTLETPIAIRAYTERPDHEPLGAKAYRPGMPASGWTLIFDCETTTDEVQRLRFGFYQIRKDHDLEDEGIFYDPDALSDTELDCLQAYAQGGELNLCTASDFRTEVFLQYGYRLDATIVGFNLPFDLSRIAISHGPARRHMRGGFSFQLACDLEDPRVRVKHLSPKAALIDFAKPGEQDTPRSMRKRGLKSVHTRGHFVDLKTLAAALLSRRFTLASLAQFLELPTQKRETDEHGLMTQEYLEYARADVQVTWEGYQALRERYHEHQLEQPVDRILSEASIGKAYLQAMHITPYLGSSTRVPREILGQIFCAYYGGRTEVRVRRQVCEVLHHDFKSMYPTVNSLMGLWEFVIADGMTWSDTTQETQQFLDRVVMDDLQRPEAWRQLHTLVQLSPDADVFPVRAKYDEKTYTVGLNTLSSESALWFTLADCIVSKLTTSKAPRIEKALTFTPGRRQKDLCEIHVMGRPDYRIDPVTDDFFTRLIDLRDEARGNGDLIEKTLKIIANSSSYGIFIEVNRDDAPKSEPLNVFGPDGTRFSACTKAIEQPGRFFHPLVGVLITGAARLMLGLAEQRALNLGLDWAFCDTDSLALVRPDGMNRNQFHEKSQQVIDWFEALNPYQKPGSILKREDVNDSINGERAEPLYCYAISAKRYALFNVGRDGRPILRKASAHGLGHLFDPYKDHDAPRDLVTPRVPLAEIGVKRWQHDFWIKIVDAALNGQPDFVRRNWHTSLSSPAASRYNASSPGLLRWLRYWNEGRKYNEQIRPFGFLLSFPARKGFFKRCASDCPVVAHASPGRPTKPRDPKPIAPYDSDPKRAVERVFDRQTGKPVETDQLQTYDEALAQYHLSPESKFDNGRHRDRGRTARRHVIATGFVLIGKEANQVGESGEEDPVSETVAEFQR